MQTAEDRIDWYKNFSGTTGRGSRPGTYPRQHAPYISDGGAVAPTTPLNGRAAAARAETLSTAGSTKTPASRSFAHRKPHPAPLLASRIYDLVRRRRCRTGWNDGVQYPSWPKLNLYLVLDLYSPLLVASTISIKGSATVARHMSSHGPSQLRNRDQATCRPSVSQ